MVSAETRRSRMARIPQEEIDRIKREMPIETLVRGRGIELRRTGENLVGRCPFHDDKTPSLIITPAKNLWHCMGACQTGGDVFAWVMKVEGVQSFRHAYELLTGGRLSPATARIVEDSSVPKLGCPFTLAMSHAELLAVAVDYYAETARRSPELRAYLKKRGIDSDEAMTTFQLGFANRTLGLRLPNMQRRGRRGTARTAAGAGTLSRDSRSRALQRLARDADLRRDGRGRRDVRPQDHAEPAQRARRCICICRGRTAACGTSTGLRESSEMILCESLIDALTFWCAGFRT